MIICEELTKTFQLTRQQKREMDEENTGSTIDALKKISFTCHPGKVFTLLGPNGAGKTTALRIIATLLKPTSGKVTVSGYDIVDQPRKVRSRIGFLTGTTGLYDRLTPNEIVKYYADLFDMDKELYKRRREELFTLLDIHSFANRRIGKLSSGMRQKVSIARTIIHDPDIIVFDEPTAGLDVVTSRNIIQLIRKCRDDGKTVLFSTHRIGEVGLLSDDLAIIHKGKLCYNGSFKDFQEQMVKESLEEEFIRLVEVA